MNKTIGVFAHVDAGKTTFSECLLYHANTIENIGRVDHKNSYLDNHEIEKQRGITIFSDQGIFEYGENRYYIVDTPGHIDFSPDMERSIMILDYAILIISSVEGIQSHTETLWRLLRKHKIPTFIFLNKMDREGSDVENVLDSLRTEFTPDILFLSKDIEQGLDIDSIEFVAERDEDLLDCYMADEYKEDLWIRVLKDKIKSCDIFPVFKGSALRDIGVKECLKALDKLTTTEYESPEFGAVVYKVRYMDNTRVTFLKVNSGCLRVRDEIDYMHDGDKYTEKITQLRVYSGGKFSRVETASMGELIGVVGLSKTKVGQGLGITKNYMEYDIVPALKSSVKVENNVSVKELVQVFKMLSDEEPSLNSQWNEELKELQLNIMGPIQLEVLKPIVKDRFNIDIEFEEPSILYRETIDTSVVGYGHFEPLKHYAEVHLMMEPMPRGSGIVFENRCHSDDLSTGNQNLIRHHVFEREHRGLLTGSPVGDIKMTLLTGRAHNKHTSGGDFRQATYRAIRQGLEQVESVLLEPYYSFKIRVDLDNMGRVINDIQRAKGTFMPPNTKGDITIIEGRAPVKTFMNYQLELLAFTKGKGSIALRFDGYDVCHNAECVIEEIGYDKNVDKLYSSSSIFCSKGQGYEVTWQNAKEAMHCSIDK